MGWFNIFQIHQEFEKVWQAKTVRERTHPIKLFSGIIYANFGVIHYYFDRGYEDIGACNDEKSFVTLDLGRELVKLFFTLSKVFDQNKLGCLSLACIFQSLQTY
jgi:hypothetical protein